MARKVLVTRGPWFTSTMGGYGITGVILSVSRHIGKQNKLLHGQLDGLVCKSCDEADELKLLYGYNKEYSRNSCKLVMTRAMRKRGYKSNDWRYNSTAEHITSERLDEVLKKISV